MNEREAVFAQLARRFASLCALNLGWPPLALWDLTPAELALILHPDGSDATAPLDRAATERLMERLSDG